MTKIVSLKAPGFHQKSSLVNKLAKSPRGVGLFFFCLAEINKWKKAPPPWGFSRDTPVVPVISQQFSRHSRQQKCLCRTYHQLFVGTPGSDNSRYFSTISRHSRQGTAWKFSLIYRHSKQRWCQRNPNKFRALQSPDRGTAW